jgi:hypothetical protein
MGAWIDNVPAPDNQMEQFSRRRQGYFPAVSIMATPVKS